MIRLSWSFPLGRLFGVTVRIHLLFGRVHPGLSSCASASTTARHPEEALPEGAWIDLLTILILLFLSVLVHEFGHGFGARFVGGDARRS